MVLPLAGFLVAQGDFAFLPALTRFVRFARQDPAKLDDAERWFRRRGPIIVLVGRCIPGVRSLVALPAGVLRMPRGQYILLTLIGSTVWNTILIGAGYVLGTQWQRVEDAVGSISDVLLPALVLAGVGALLWRRRRSRTGSVRRDASPPTRE